MNQSRTFGAYRRGRIHLAWLAFVGSIGLLAALIALAAWQPHDGEAPSEEPLTVFCAAGLKAPVEVIARQYEREYGVPVRLQFGGSQNLLANIEVAKRGDLFLPADESYITIAHEKGLLRESISLAEMHPVLAVHKGNPKQVRSLDDLLTGKLNIAQANPDAAAIGKLTRDLLKKTGEWDQLKERTTVSKMTVNDVANDIKLGTVDAGIVWDATVKQYPDLESVAVPQFAGAASHVFVGVLSSCEQPTAALRFARYLAARDKGLPELEKGGFKPVEGDAWAETPELQLFAGAMLRPAIEETITAFEKREGVRVSRVYNGCGILVAQMRAGQSPDAYFACDKSFMTQVSDLFPQADDISTNRLVILVHKGNPKNIHSLEDLGQPDLRLGVGHEKQCALGALTQITLKESGTQAEVMKNVKVRSPAGDMLVNQLRTGSLDAVIAYLSNGTAAADALDAISIEGLPCSIATQPMAVNKDSQHKQLAGRLRDTLESAESRTRFEEMGFQWKLGAQ